MIAPGPPGGPERSEWRRLDPRMLLVHPVRELVRFLPVLLLAVVAGTGSAAPWELLGVAAPVAVGVLRYLTTGFRTLDDRIELRRGLLHRHVLSVPLDRVRTVDLTASPVHRVLDLVTLRIGTGTGGEDDLDLDGLRSQPAREFREALLRLAGAAPQPTGGAGPAKDATTDSAAPVAATVTLDPRWVRYAPFTGTGVVVVAGVAGAAGQLLSAADGVRAGARGWGDPAALAVWLTVPLLVLVLLVAVVVADVAGYLVTNWRFTLTRRAGAWHVSRGLLTTRETSLDEERVAGVSVSEPIGLRLAGGARLVAIATGLDREQRGSAVLVPPAPRLVVERAAAQVLGSASALDEPLHGHGPAAARRRWTRGLGPAVLPATGAGALVALGEASAWVLAPTALVVVAAAALAADRARALGHRLAGRHLVSRSGSLARRRDVLATDHVIGWTFRDTWFQRRAGLVTLVATTAGGRQAVTVLDVPLDRATGLAGAAVPGLVDQFRGSPPGG